MADFEIEPTALINEASVWDDQVQYLDVASKNTELQRIPSAQAGVFLNTIESYNDFVEFMIARCNEGGDEAHAIAERLRLIASNYTTVDSW